VRERGRGEGERKLITRLFSLSHFTLSLFVLLILLAKPTNEIYGFGKNFITVEE